MSSRSSTPFAFSATSVALTVPASSSNCTRFFFPVDALFERFKPLPLRTELIARMTYGMPTSRKVLMTWFVTVMAYIWSCSRFGLSLPRALLPSVSQRCSVLAVALYASFTTSAAALAVGLADESEESIVDAQALAEWTGVSLWKRYNWTQDMTSSPKGT